MALSFCVARHHPAVVATPLRDGTAVLLHLDSKRYFSVNADGWRCWQTLGPGGTQLMADSPVAEAFWQALADHGLVEPLTAGEPSREIPAVGEPQLTAYPSLAGITFLSGGGVAGPVVI